MEDDDVRSGTSGCDLDGENAEDEGEKQPNFLSAGRRLARRLIRFAKIFMDQISLAPDAAAPVPTMAAGSTIRASPGQL
ncbi:hypothetical protein HFO60_27290 [Rhizobium leguminosarum]|uniref:hypothetical protein n=1 Tax=Rhizobium leguminosarum TaxID=384 RepID=UPI001C94E5DE|nr:hypothetical protein [Rhizobium leguminosarum]MBY5543672.1 hypothetical protein [Rhizobium leguminosarum]